MSPSAPLLVAGAEEAIPKRDEQIRAFQELAAVLPEDMCMKWTEEVKAWELDHEKPNPYQNDQKSAGLFRELNWWCC